VVSRVKPDYSWVFFTYCVRRRVFSYLGDRFCGSAGRPAQAKALMHSIAFLAGRS